MKVGAPISTDRSPHADPMLANIDACSAPGLMTVDDALAVALAAVRRMPESETVALSDSVGRVAASDVTAAISLPPFDQSAVDGYGLRADEVALAASLSFRQAGTLFAGAADTLAPAPGEVVRLLTGAPIPADVDGVMMEEKVLRDGSMIRFPRPVEPGLNIRRRGEDLGAGSTIVEAGTLVDARHIAILAATGVAKLKVRRPIRLGILSTGSELVPAGKVLGRYQIHDSNGSMLRALFTSPACQTTSLGRCRDDRDRLQRRLTQISRSYDLLVCSGGVSGSDADHIVSAVADAGGACAKLALALKPGKPLAIGRLGEMAILALPGNPFAALVGALLFARPMVQSLAGSFRGPASPAAALTKETFSHRGGRLEFVPVRAAALDERGIPLLEKLGRGGSARLWPLVLADGLASLPADAEDLPAGTPIDYYPFGGAFAL
jgi:molybdopterin molybdotransferase